MGMDAHHREVLQNIEPVVKCLIAEHIENQNLWLPFGLLYPRGYSDDRTTLLITEALQIPQSIRAGFVLNALTESGLPHFHRLLATHLGEMSSLCEWTDLWTAEENRHDGVLHDYMRITRFVDIPTVELLQYRYMNNGFRPDWNLDPYLLIAYTVLQEQATQVSHANVAKLVNKTAPSLSKILGAIAGEEGKHAQFYRTVFAEVLSKDLDRALVALCAVARDFAMPGNSIPGYAELSQVADRVGIFSGEDFSLILEKVYNWLDIGSKSPQSDGAKFAQERFHRLPILIRKARGRTGMRDEKVYRFGFLSEPFVL